MKEYPHIQGSTKAPQLPCIAFYKYNMMEAILDLNINGGQNMANRTWVFKNNSHSRGKRIRICTCEGKKEYLLFPSSSVVIYNYLGRNCGNCTGDNGNQFEFQKVPKNIFGFYDEEALD